MNSVKQGASWMRVELDWFLERIRDFDDASEFDEALFLRVVDSGMVFGGERAGEVKYTFKFGRTVTSHGNDRPLRAFDKMASE